MKSSIIKLLSLLLTVILFYSCSEIKDFGSNPVSPSSDNDPFAKFSIIKLPKPLNARLDKRIYSVPTLITPDKGGKVQFSYSYQAINNSWVGVDLSLTFLPGAVTDSTTITISLVDDALKGDVALDYGPSPTTFLIPAKLDLNTFGLDLSYLPDSSVLKLLYLAQDGSVIVVPTFKIIVNKASGSIQCVDGVIPHFSRYAFGN